MADSRRNLRRFLLFWTLMLMAGGEALLAQKDFSSLDQWMQENVHTLGGRAILVIYQDGKTIYSRSVTDMNGRQKALVKYVAKKQGLEPDFAPFTEQSRLLIASCSKWLSAALVMSFVDEGRIHLSDTVGLYLPILSLHGKGNITLAECLSHTTGIKAPSVKQSLNHWKDVRSMDQAIEEIAVMPMEGEPGKVFHYSNAGFQIAGAVLEKITDSSFENLFAARIARPLDMKNTDFGNGPVALPAGGARSNTADYINFLAMILQKGNFNGRQILSERSLEEMQANRITPDIRIIYSPDDGGELGYALGEWVPKTGEAGQPAVWVTSPGLFGSFPWIDNQKRYAAFLMTFNLNFKERQQGYLELKKRVDLLLP